MAVRKGLLAAWMLSSVLVFGAGLLTGFKVRQGMDAAKTEFKARCLEVLDGDTVSVTWALGTNRVRLAGIDALEVHNTKKLREQAEQLGIRPRIVEMMAKNSRNELAQKLTGRDVMLVFPEGGDKRDSFGRLLSYVEVDGVDIGAWMLENGWAYPRKEKHPRLEEYAGLHRLAQVNNKGLFVWKDDGSTE